MISSPEMALLGIPIAYRAVSFIKISTFTYNEGNCFFRYIKGFKCPFFCTCIYFMLISQRCESFTPCNLMHILILDPYAKLSPRIFCKALDQIPRKKYFPFNLNKLSISHYTLSTLVERVTIQKV